MLKKKITVYDIPCISVTKQMFKNELTLAKLRACVFCTDYTVLFQMYPIRPTNLHKKSRN